MIIKNFLLAYNSRLLSLLISSFGELCDGGTRIEDAYVGGATTTKASNPVNVSAIIPQQTVAYLSFTKKAC